MSRREARKAVLTALYQLEFLDHVELPVDELGEQASFVRDIYDGTRTRMEEIDGLISKFASGWRLERLAVIDRNILRMALYELLYYQKTPPEVVINEAVELSKKYGTEKSSSFINGILDRVWKEKSPAS
ncbi:MAG: transcription antitermination factor NusB [Candidatus Acetothermia bacterium]